MFDSILISKIMTALAYPAGLLLVFISLSKLFDWSRRNALALLCKLSFWAVLVFSTSPIFSSWLVSSLEQQHPQQPFDEIAAHDVIIVLGGGLSIPVPPRLHSQFNSASDRYWHATQLYKAGKAKKIVIAGGNVFQLRDHNGVLLKGEAFFARQLLVQWGVDNDHIVVEDNSRTTEQNRNNLASLIRQQTVESALLVTSAIHMPRAYTLFSELPIVLTPASADVMITKSNRPIVLNWLPSASAMSMTTIALHEYYGLCVLYFSRLFK